MVCIWPGFLPLESKPHYLKLRLETHTSFYTQWCVYLTVPIPAVEERLKQEEQVVSKLKIKINSMEHEHYLLELRVEREQKHKQSVCQVC